MQMSELAERPETDAEETAAPETVEAKAEAETIDMPEGGEYQPQKPIIRPARLDDVPELVEMGAQFMATGEYWGERRAFEPVGFAHHLIELLRSPIAGVFVAEAPGGEVAGIVALIVMRDIFSRSIRAMKLHWFVPPDSAGLGLRLEKRARKWAAEKGAVSITMSAVNDDAEKLLDRLGYARTEVLYHKAI